MPEYALPPSCDPRVMSKFDQADIAEISTARNALARMTEALGRVAVLTYTDLLREGGKPPIVRCISSRHASSTHWIGRILDLMATVDAVLQDQLLRLLEGAPKGITVERLRSLLQTGGSQARKDEIARALRALSERGLVQIGAARKWHIRRYGPTSTTGTRLGQTASFAEWITAIPCSAFLGDEAVPEDAIPEGQLAPDLLLLKRLLLSPAT